VARIRILLADDSEALLAGGQATFLMPAKKLALCFKYEHEYLSYSHTLGTTIVFGGSWTLSIPKSPPAK
jgi:hypothetical protein